jgi:hypothetical protein
MQCHRYGVTSLRASAIAVTASDCWIATAAVQEGVWPEVWCVTVTYVPDRGNGPAIQALCSTDLQSAQSSRPCSLHISDDHVLAIALGTGGVRLYKLRIPLPPVVERDVALVKELGRGLYVACARWVAPSSSSKVSLVIHAREPCRDRVLAHGSVIESYGCGDEVLTAGYGDVLAFDASRSGYVMVVTVALVMHLLQLQSDGRFCVRTVQLGASTDCPTPLTFRAAAIGTRLAAVGYDTPCGDGLVEVFEVDTGDVAAWRLLKGRSPTALATDERRVTVGASRRSGSRSMLYGFVPSYTLCYTIAVGGKLQGDWCPGTMVMNRDCLVFAQLLDEGELVVDHWLPSARYLAAGPGGVEGRVWRGF